VEAREFKDGIFEQLARVGGAFGSPKRVEIIDLLAQGERSVESIASATGMTVANTSRHLGILRNSGLVTTRRDGLYVMYRVADPSVVIGYQALRALAESQVAEVRHLADAFFGDLDGAEPLSLDELLARSGAGDVVVVDVRPRLEYEAGHLPEAINIPLGELADRVADFDPDAMVVAYCRGPYCVLAAQAVAQLRGAGLQAKRLDGGPLEWSAAGLPLTLPSDDATLGVALN
jgi:rhodanese-related sulfurtransferase